MFRTQHRRILGIVVGGMAVAAALLGSVTSTASTTAAASRPSTTSASFSGISGPGAASPYRDAQQQHQLRGYTANGQVYGNQLYFLDDNIFEAGHNDSAGADCIGIIVVSWSDPQVVLRFGNVYGTFTHWNPGNGNGYAGSVDNAIWGGTVSGLR